MRALILLFLLNAAHAACAQEGLLPKYNADGSGLWLQGYDPVAYLVDHRAVKGDARFATQHEGVTFRFTSQAHKELFASAPGKYVPQYGGWCAYAMGAKNTKYEVDPATFKVKDGKVYLFYKGFFTNTLDEWNKDEGRLLPAADRNWSAFKHQAATKP